jgi:hypothetical protein
MTEDFPHLVYSKEYPITGVSWLCPNYKSAYERWAAQHSYKTPYLIRVVLEPPVLGRTIDPAEAITGPGE